MDSLKSLQDRIVSMISRAVLTSIDNSQVRQFLQLRALKGENKDKVERALQYGQISNPLSGAQVLMICVGGSRSHPVAISVDDPRYRPKDGEEGETGTYHYQGHTIRLLKDGIVQIDCNTLKVIASEKARFETPLFEVTGEITDRCDEDGKTMSHMREVYDIHVHPENDSGGPTDEPNEKMSD